MRLGRRFAAVGVAAVLLLSVAASATFAYQGQIVNQVTVTGPAGSISCGVPLTLHATLLDSNGVAVDNRAVVWTFGAGHVTGDQIGQPSTTTNALGVATTTVTLACLVGNRTIVATAGSSSGQTVLILGQIVGGATGSPAAGTTTTPPPTAGSSPTGIINGSTPMWVLVFLGACLLLLLILVARFMMRRRVVAGR